MTVCNAARAAGTNFVDTAAARAADRNGRRVDRWKNKEDAVKIEFGKAALAGLAGTAAMTALMLLAPRMGLPPMNIGAMLGSVMGGNVALGWMAHVMIGTILALIYAALFAGRLPGSPTLSGALYAVGPWLMAQLVVMPMMGMGLFSGSMLAAGGSLMGHLVYGAVLGSLYGFQPCADPDTCNARG